MLYLFYYQKVTICYDKLKNFHRGDCLEEIKKEPVTVLFILLNILIFVIVDFTGGSENTVHMIACGAAYPPLILEEGETYRLFTCMFLHFGIYHIANNMLVLFVLGQRLEPVLGKVKFILVYLLGGLGGNIFSLLMETKKAEYAVSAGASGAVFAVMGAMLYVVIRSRGRIQDISVRQMMIMAGFSLYFGFTSTGVDNAAHVGGLVCGFILAALLYHPGKVSGRRI